VLGCRLREMPAGRRLVLICGYRLVGTFTSFVVTRDGVPVAELSPLRRRSAPPAELIARRRTLPPVDPESLRRDVDEILNASV